MLTRKFTDYISLAHYCSCFYYHHQQVYGFPGEERIEQHSFPELSDPILKGLVQVHFVYAYVVCFHTYLYCDSKHQCEI